MVVEKLQENARLTDKCTQDENMQSTWICIAVLTSQHWERKLKKLREKLSNRAKGTRSIKYMNTYHFNSDISF